MGASQSGEEESAKPTVKKTVSRHVATFKKLYDDLSNPDELGEPANNDLFRVCNFFP